MLQTDWKQDHCVKLGINKISKSKFLIHSGTLLLLIVQNPFKPQLLVYDESNEFM